MGESHTTTQRSSKAGTKDASKVNVPTRPTDTKQRTLLSEEIFQTLLKLERRRSERSRKRFILMLVNPVSGTRPDDKVYQDALPAIASATRETDLIGWYCNERVLGVIFTEVGNEEKTLITETLRGKIEGALVTQLGKEGAAKIHLSIHVFPEDWDREHAAWVADSKLYPELQPEISRKRIPLAIKRAIDIAGSGILLLLMLPALAAIAIAVKLSSKGPILFEQDRLGQFAARFKCLKFRTMYTDSDPKIHQDYIQQFISGDEELTEKNPAKQTVYKIENDPRITPIGRFLRKNSLDELPQFWNVLRGEMSLVGPRPPLPYEFEIYDVWHRRRVLELRPGVTGLWQVSGRSRTSFDDMVRLDLRYSQSWSLGLDLKILFATPKAVFSGDGAY